VKALPRPSVSLVTARKLLSPGARTVASEVVALERWLDEAIDAGVDLIQVRERDLAAVVLGGLVSRLVERARLTPTLIVVNERTDIALATGADGVHLRSDGPAVDRVRTLRPSGWIVGRSIHRGDALDVHRRADYLLFGTVFGGGSKRSGTAPIAGIDGLRAAAAGTPLRVLAIGGITPPHARACVEAGAAGVAAIGLFLPEGRSPLALGAARAVQELRAAMDAPGRQR
jgi:thiamine-phosphate pyrophosphorylase